MADLPRDSEGNPIPTTPDSVPLKLHEPADLTSPLEIQILAPTSWVRVSAKGGDVHVKYGKDEDHATPHYEVGQGKPEFLYLRRLIEDEKLTHMTFSAKDVGANVVIVEI